MFAQKLQDGDCWALRGTNSSPAGDAVSQRCREPVNSVAAGLGKSAGTGGERPEPRSGLGFSREPSPKCRGQAVAETCGSQGGWEVRAEQGPGWFLSRRKWKPGQIKSL